MVELRRVLALLNTRGTSFLPKNLTELPSVEIITSPGESLIALMERAQAGSGVDVERAAFFFRPNLALAPSGI